MTRRRCILKLDCTQCCTVGALSPSTESTSGKKVFSWQIMRILFHDNYVVVYAVSMSMGDFSALEIYRLLTNVKNTRQTNSNGSEHFCSSNERFVLNLLAKQYANGRIRGSVLNHFDSGPPMVCSQCLSQCERSSLFAPSGLNVNVR